MCVYVCAHKFPSWPAGQDWRNEQSVGVRDKLEGAGSSWIEKRSKRRELAMGDERMPVQKEVKGDGDG